MDSVRLPKFRFVVLCLSVWASIEVYTTRTNINNAIVSMVAPEPDENATSLISDLCPFHDGENVSSHGSSELHGETFHWGHTTQGLILSSFYYGVIITQVPAGRLSELFGGKWLVAAGIFFSGLINIVTPWVARYLWLLVTSRIIPWFAPGIHLPGCLPYDSSLDGPK